VYHVQTEDSGSPHAHYITHLFLGGNIVASMKASYADKAADPDLQRIVRGLMETQHKAMLRRLVSGEFNELADRVAAPHHYEPGVLATGEAGPRAVNAPSGPAPKAAPPPATKAPPRPLPPAPRPPAPRQPVWQPAPPGASPPPSPRMPGAPLPQTTRVPPAGPRAPVSPPRIVPSPQPRAATRPPQRPAARAQDIFADERPVEAPHEDLPTLFAEELISEKSLDEVILAFLSADLEPPK
jgi:hypothetical protein